MDRKPAEKTAEKKAQAERIKAALEKRNWSAGKLAKKMTERGAKTARTTTYQWIDKDNPSTPSDWATLADVLEDTVEWLRDGKTSHSQIDTSKYLMIFRIVLEETSSMGYSLTEEQLISITSMIYNHTPGPIREVDRSLVTDAVLLARL